MNQIAVELELAEPLRGNVNHFLRRYIPLGITLILGTGLSIIAAMFVGRWESSNSQIQFQRQIENLATALQRSSNRYIDILISISDYYAAAQLQIERRDFNQFVQRSLKSYPGIQALEWAPLVKNSDRLTYEQQMRATGHRQFHITELTDKLVLTRADDRPQYIPVTYVEPLEGNEAALGYDLNSNPIRAAAIQTTRDTGQVIATGRIRLVQEQRDQFGYLVFLPIYRGVATPASVAERRTRLEGFLLGVFRVSDVIEESLQNLSGDINFTLYDQNATPEKRLLGFYDATSKRLMTTEPDRPLAATRNSPLLQLCPHASECTHILTVGQRRWLLVFSPAASYPIGTNYGAIATLLIGLVLTGGLVLFLHTLNMELDRTKELSQLKFRFFSMASHELRTPLSTILLSSESLQTNHTQLSEAQRHKNIQRIHLAAKRMSQQISDILMLTRVQVGKPDFNPELFDLEPFCQQLLDEMQMGITQTLVFDGNCHTTRVFFDKKLLRSMLTNLWSNAIKYSSSQSSIDFSLKCDFHSATFQIHDRGIGIPAEDQPHIWETFFRGSNVGEVLGTGLGLAVVKTCVELHQGQLAIISQVGQGTTVTVELPLESVK